MMASEQDILNVEHLGNWDHGVEPDPLDASFSKNNEEESEFFKEHSAEFITGTKRLVQKVCNSVSKACNRLNEKASELRRNEGHLREEIEDYMEEEIGVAVLFM